MDRQTLCNLLNQDASASDPALLELVRQRYALLQERRRQLGDDDPTAAGLDAEIQTLADGHALLTSASAPVTVTDDGRLPGEADSEVGTLLGARFRLLEQLGQGGMAEVWRARDEQLDMQVAVKRLLPHLTDRGDLRERFWAEAKAALLLHHPDIVRVHHVDRDRSRQYMVMELLQGESLAEHLAALPDRRMPVATAVRLMAQLCEALDFAHRQGVVHRDIKPANLWMDAGTGRCKVIDFGIARLVDGPGLTQTGNQLGTLRYMAPEQLQGRKVDARADQWALGCVLVELLSGEPVECGQPLRSMTGGLPSGLRQALRRALAHDPEHRYPSIADFGIALAEVVPGDTRGGSTETPARRPGGPRLALASLLIAMLGVGLWWGGAFDVRTSSGDPISAPTGDRARARQELEERWRTAWIALLDGYEDRAPESRLRERQSDHDLAMNGLDTALSAAAWTSRLEMAESAVREVEAAVETLARVSDWALAIAIHPPEQIPAIWRERIRATGLPWQVRDRDSQVLLQIVPPGDYRRGASDDDELAQDGEQPRHDVRITRGFYLGRYEISNAEYGRFDPEHGSGVVKGRSLAAASQPVARVSWLEAQAYCDHFDFRLPTGAEWEYAARAGVTSRFPWGTAEGDGAPRHGNVADQAFLKIGAGMLNFDWDDGHAVSAPVGSFDTNPLGLCDLWGNVAEWCSDHYSVGAYLLPGTDTDPRGPAAGAGRVVRGGSWWSAPTGARLSVRQGKAPNEHFEDVGFRVVRMP